jgi:peptide/nickel transport system substrate-binding protein
VLLAVGQMWSQIGLDVEVETVPANVYFGRATDREFSAFMVAFGITTGESSLALRNVLGTFDADRGWGSNNRFRYSSAEFDAALERALTAFEYRGTRGRPAGSGGDRGGGLRADPDPLGRQQLGRARGTSTFTPSVDGRSLITNLGLN